MRAFEGELAARDLQALDEIGGAGEQHAPAVLDEGEPEGCRQMALAAAGRAEQQEIGALLEPAVAGGERHDLRLADHRHGVEVEGVERLARRQSASARWRSMRRRPRSAISCSASAARKRAAGQPSLSACCGELGPDQLDGGQAQIGKQEFEAGGVDRIGRLHATPPSMREIGLRRTNSGQLVVGGERHQLDGNVGITAVHRA